MKRATTDEVAGSGHILIKGVFGAPDDADFEGKKPDPVKIQYQYDADGNDKRELNSGANCLNTPSPAD